MSEIKTDVFIAGSGISGVYAAILLSKLGLNIHIAEQTRYKNKSEIVLLSPRTIHLLQQLNLLPALTEKGVRHWKLDIYSTTGQDVKLHSLRLWDNDITEFNYAISIEKSVLHGLLKDYLSKQLNLEIESKQEILDIIDHSQHNDLNLYYQYRPLPTPVSHHDLSLSPQHDLKTVYTRNTDTQTTQTIKAKTIIAADGQSSAIRRKLGIRLINNSYNKASRIFYTLQINIITTNFPSTRQVSIITKKKDIIYIIGQEKKFYITFEHKPSWSKVSIDDEIPVLVATEHIRYMFDPYRIEFGKVKSFTRWDAKDQLTSEEYCFNSSYFFVGTAAQSILPPGIFDTNINIEQVQMLCWKLALSLKNKSSAVLENTFESEARSKSLEAIHISGVFTNLIGDYYKIQEETETNVNASHVLDILYQLNRLKSCFIGQSQLPSNILNYTFEEQLDMGSTDDLTDHTASKTSFEFVPPPSATTTVPPSATPGSLAPNARLKPYTLFQLLLTSNQPKPPLASTLSSNLLLSSQEDLKQQPQPDRSRSNSITSGTKWLPKFQKSSEPKRASISISSDRWKSIKTAYLQLIDRIRHVNANGATFTLLVFCGAIGDVRLHPFIQTLNSPASFISQYQDHGDPLFATLFICRSTKQEALQYLSHTPPSMVHTTFNGLEHVFLDHDQQCYKTYDVKKPQVVVLRPDGYIGTRVMMDEHCFTRLNAYFDSFLRPSVDMNSAAAVVAASYDYE